MKALVVVALDTVTLAVRRQTSSHVSSSTSVRFWLRCTGIPLSFTPSLQLVFTN